MARKLPDDALGILAEVMEVRTTMAILNKLIITGTVALIGVGVAQAQVSPAEAEQIRIRQQIATMEKVLETAIGIGAQNVIAQVRRVVSDRPRLGQARISGTRLENYGVVFHVEIPMFRLPMMFQVVVRDMQTRDALMRIQQLKTQATGMTPGPERTQLLDQASQLEQQLALGNFRPAEPSRGVVGAASLVPAGVTRTGVVEPSVLDDPVSAYTSAVIAALIDAMLKSSQALEVKTDEYLAVIARDGVPNDPQFPGDTLDSTTQVIRVKGSVLAAYQSKAISIDEARKLVEVKEQ